MRIPFCGEIRQGDILELGAIMDEAGFHSGWVGDHIVYPLLTSSLNASVEGGRYPAEIMAMPTYEAFNLLAFTAAATTRTKIGLGCCVLPQRHPVLVAKEVATIDQLSNGRMILGVVGGWLEEEFEALDAPFAQRRARLEEGVALMRHCWEVEHPSWNGDQWQFPPLQFQPKPQQRPMPVWFGGRSPQALRRAAQIGDGWCGSGHLLPDDATSFARRLRRYRDEGPRQALPFTVMSSYFDDPRDGRNRLTRIRLCDLIAQYQTAGVDVLLLDSVVKDARAVIALAELAADTLP
jgi:probable F420-dependent oxidoreductase